MDLIIENFNNLINSFAGCDILNSKIDELLNEACELLKQNQVLRQNQNENFYKILFNFINENYNENKTINGTFVLVIKLLRNASGANKNEFYDYEFKIQKILLTHLNKLCVQHEHLNDDYNENFKNFVVFSLQYFANLIQG